jgi:hypothetical protein
VNVEYSPDDPPGTGRAVCGATGVADLITALGTPSVVLFGLVPRAEWAPQSHRPHGGALRTGQRGDPHAERAAPRVFEITLAEDERAVINSPAHLARHALPQRNLL